MERQSVISSPTAAENRETVRLPKRMGAPFCSASTTSLTISLMHAEKPRSLMRAFGGSRGLGPGVVSVALASLGEGPCQLGITVRTKGDAAEWVKHLHPVKQMNRRKTTHLFLKN